MVQIPVVEWAVLRVPPSARYLIGVNKRTREVIVSAPIRDFDPPSRRLKDADGNLYELTDIGLVSVPARRAWRHWCREHGEPGFVEVINACAWDQLKR